eukprot:Lankesteria_metandrocarpae@DN8235_c0_g1_i1.p2
MCSSNSAGGGGASNKFVDTEAVVTYSTTSRSHPPPRLRSRSCKIQLSTKVLDDEHRMQKTLLHECCHAAQFLLEGETRPPHGPGFRKWAAIATSAFPHLEVTTCHSYTIHCPHKWRCLLCGHVYGRHSKSIDAKKQCCGKNGCRGKLEYMGTFAADGTPKKPRNASAYNTFIKNNFSKFKHIDPSLSTTDIMILLSDEWKKEKCDAKICSGDNDVPQR